MQAGNASSSSATSIRVDDFSLTENSSDEIKLHALKKLMPKAENAKNRIGELRSFALVNIEDGLQFIAKIRTLVMYMGPLLDSAADQIKGAGQLVDALMTYRSHVKALENQLEAERTMLDDFTRALHQLRSTRVDPRLQAQVLPELPPEEQTGTLVDWANQAELLNTFQLLVEDRNQMLSVAEWGIKQILIMRDKHTILVEELAACNEGAAATKRLDLDALAQELEAARVTANSIFSECTTHYERTLEAVKREDASSAWLLAQSDVNLVQQFMAMGKCRSRVGNIHGDLSVLLPKSESIATRIHALASETHGVVSAANEMVSEFESLDEDINGYLRGDGDLGAYTDLVRSTQAWADFVTCYDDLLAELARRRAVLQRRLAIAEQYRRALEESCEEETLARLRFDEDFNRPQVPTIWRTGECLTEPTTRFELVPVPSQTVIPDLSEHMLERQTAKAEARRAAETHLQPKLSDRFTLPPSTASAASASSAANTSSQIDSTSSELASTSLDSSYAQSQIFSNNPRATPSLAPLGTSSNSLLDSRLTITESMLGDSTAIFHSASDQFSAADASRAQRTSPGPLSGYP